MASLASYVRERAAIRDLYADIDDEANKYRSTREHKKGSESTNKVKGPGTKVSSERAEQSSFNPMDDEDELSSNQTGTPYDSQVLFPPGLNDADKNSNKSHGAASGAFFSSFVSNFFRFISIFACCVPSRQQASKKKGRPKDKVFVYGEGIFGKLDRYASSAFKSEAAGMGQHIEDLETVGQKSNYS